MHQQLPCGGDLVWVKHGTSQAFYRQKRLHLDLEEWHSRRRNSFELTFSLESGPRGALGLRLCNETARGREELGFVAWFFICFGPWAGTIKGGKQYLSLVPGPVTGTCTCHWYLSLEPVTGTCTCHWYLYLSLVAVPVT